MKTDRIRELEQQYDAARKSAEVVYLAELDAADTGLDRARLEAEEERLAAHKAINARCRRSGDWTKPKDKAARVQADEACKARFQEIDEAYKALCNSIRGRYDAATEAAEDEFETAYDEHCAEQQRTAAIAARKRQRAEQKAARLAAKARKKEARERTAANFELVRKMVEAAATPVFKISPKQAAARCNLTIAAFWARVRSGRYPPPGDDNLYHVETVDRFPRPKVRPVHRAVPNSILSQIWKF